MTVHSEPGTMLAKLEGAERALAQVATAQDAVQLIDLAEAARVFARQAKLGTSSVNHATAIKLKAERRLADVVDEGQAAGQIAGKGEGGGGRKPRNNVRRPDIITDVAPTVTVDSAPAKPVTLDEIGVDRRRLNEARTIRDTYSDEDIDEIVEEATEQDVTVARRDFVQKRAHVAQNTGNNEWYTPPEFIEAARAVFRAGPGFHDPNCDDPFECDCSGIELDPATSEKAQETVKAPAYYTAEHDGLIHDWHGCVWMNPPYAQPLIGKFVDKLIHHWQAGDVPAAIVLVNNGTETAWGQKLLERASAVCFPAGRIKFHDAEGNPGAPLQGQMIVYLASGQDMLEDRFEFFGEAKHYDYFAEFKSQFSQFGAVLAMT